MARINIEDEFWDLIPELTEKIGNEIQAIGYSLKFLRAAQRAYKKGRAIPKDEFHAKYHPALIGIFAIELDHGFEALGAEKHFGWLRNRVENAKKGGESKSSLKTKHLMQNQVVSSEANPKQMEANPKPLTLPLPQNKTLNTGALNKAAHKTNTGTLKNPKALASEGEWETGKPQQSAVELMRQKISEKGNSEK